MTLQRTFVLRTEDNARQLHAFLKANWRALSSEGKPLQILCTEYKRKRNTEQNKRLWAMLNEIAESAWVGGKRYPADVWHEQMKRQFIGVTELPNGGAVGISTTSLSVSEFAEYMTKIERYAAEELGVAITV